MNKRSMAFALTLTLLLAAVWPAVALDIGKVDTALARWLGAYPAIRFHATLDLKTQMPFSQPTVAMMNAALGHVRISGAVTSGENGAEQTAIRLSMDEDVLFSAQESVMDQQKAFTLSLLPNRTLTSQDGSPLDLLLAGWSQANQPSTAPDVLENGEAQAEPDAQTDVPEAFSMLEAITELRECYQSLTAGITPLTEEKRANYNIKGIGAGKHSRVARLTSEQSEALLPQLRAVLACGMDDAYRGEIAQVTFEKGFIVALYLNADRQDMCLYMKGNLIYPDGDKRKIVWQWAFTTDGIQRKDQFRYDASRLKGTADTRSITASLTQVSRSDAFSLNGKSETRLKRGKVTDLCTDTLDLSGKQDASQLLTMAGEMRSEVTQTLAEDTTKHVQLVTADLAITPDAEGAILSGNATYQITQDKKVQTEIGISFADAAPVMEDAPAADNGATVTITSTDETSSLDLLGDLFVGDEAAAEGQEYLVGTLPIGIRQYPVPSVVTSLSLDALTQAQSSVLLAEASQNLAVRLVAALANLPAEDAAILYDGMTEADQAELKTLLGL